MASHDARWSSIWAWPLLVMASTASAFSLSNFQIISSASVPLGCILAYNSPIPGCTMNDFVRGKGCSAACVNGLTKVQNTLESACYDVNADSGTVLGQVLLGNLVALVCPGSSPETPVSTPSKSSTAAPTTVTRTTSSRPALTFTTVRPSSTTTSASTTQTDEPDTDTESSTSGPSPTDAPGTQLTTIPFEQSSPPTSASSSPSSTTRAASPDPTPDNSSGFGSPFDVVASGSTQLAARWAAILVALGVGLLFLC